MSPELHIDNARLEAVCRTWRVRELSIFGSALRDDFGPGSDVDVLVSFEKDAPWSLWELIRFRDELADVFGRPVDLVEREGLRNPFRAREIVGTREVLYAS